jgi:hypothetical protein
MQTQKINIFTAASVHSAKTSLDIVNGSKRPNNRVKLYNPFFHSTKSDLSPTLAYSP